MILVLGSNGQLGSCFRISLDGVQTNFLTKDDLDVTSESEITEHFENNKYSYVINCAAYTNVDKAESEKDLAQKVNSHAPKLLAAASIKYRFKFIHISTDYVFDGNKNTPYVETDKTAPKSIYGQTKREGEILTQEAAKSSLIIRTSWLYSELGKNFITNIKRLMEERENLGIVYDQIGSPTYAQDLADAITHIIKYDSFIPGIYHFANSGVATWFDLSKEVQTFFKIECRIEPIDTADYPTPAKRPSYSVLNTKKFRNDFNYNIQYWKESLHKCLKKIS